VPLQIQCSSCGHLGTVPDKLVGKEIQCPKCQKVLVPLTQEKMENFAAKVLFAAQGQPKEETIEAIPAEVVGPEVLFVCPFCHEEYNVSADLAGKKITCRNCREPCKVDDGTVDDDDDDEVEETPKRKKRRGKKSPFPHQLLWLCVFLSLFFLLVGLLLGRIFTS